MSQLTPAQPPGPISPQRQLPPSPSLEAEIVESELLWDSEPVSEQDSQETSADWIFSDERDYLSPIRPWLDPWLTPWGLSALVVLLLANMLLVWGYLFSPRREAVEPTASQPSFQKSPPHLNLAGSQSQIELTSLSTATPSEPAMQAAASPETSLTSPPGTARPQPSLSNSLLPPTPPAQLVPSYPVPQSLIPAYQPSLLPAAPTSPPAAPSIQPLMGELPPPPAPPAANPADLYKQSIIQQDLERIRQERENPPPLGFNQEYRVKVQSLQNQTDPNQMRQQMQQLQKQQVMPNFNN